ncbi:hypothetical protein D8674_017830 [Pyrus ussuriensis x Pyrus communis]|uniref:Uncharacterized protein n=1 Tax=Pyrus ussuriensis x Pyrus communis TaxID=2448454 RepID=A0A5N5HKV4_9ROSA|nr:hypothetical protein D8674_017830 [Pyrus ussuriensis x Pyrus communis]
MRLELVQSHHRNKNHCNQKASSASTMSLHARGKIECPVLEPSSGNFLSSLLATTP